MDESQRKNPERAYRIFLEERVAPNESKKDDIYRKVSIEIKNENQSELERDFYGWTSL